jgi:hypothetical protein
MEWANNTSLNCRTQQGSRHAKRSEAAVQIVNTRIVSDDDAGWVLEMVRDTKGSDFRFEHTINRCALG